MERSEPDTQDPIGIHGVVPPTITVFDDEERVDYERTAAHARFVVDGGVHGVFPLGTNGEYTLLSADERRGVIDAVVAEVGDDVPVIAGVGTASTHETIRQAEHAETVGADGIVVVTPYYYPVDSQGMITHYERIADAVSLPIYVYHIPGRTGNTLRRETISALAEIDSIVGLKDSSKDVPWLVQVLDDNPDLTALIGSDTLLLTALDVGCAGQVSGVANVFPELVVELYDAYRNGDRERADTIQRRVFGIRDAFKAGGSYMAGVKSALAIRGFEAGPLRSPLRLMDDSERETLETRLETLDLDLDIRSA